MVSQPLYVDIDVAKATLDVAVRPTAQTWSVTHDDTGITALGTQVSATAPTLVVLAAAGIPVVVVNPRQVRAFAQAVGTLAKTDRLDARVLAHCAENEMRRLTRISEC